MAQKGFPKDILPTPTRFLLESGAYNFTPGLLTTIASGETNPFEASFEPNQNANRQKRTEEEDAESQDERTSKKRAQSDSDDEDDDVKRQKFLQKNRAAASKCRQKKKEWIQELESKADDATKKNEELVMSVTQLREELMTLKNMLLAHKDCNCNMIQKYIHSSGQFNYLMPETQKQ